MPQPLEVVDTASHRLPTNRRRAKVAPENRKRVPTACNSCNVRRVKCSGEHPCAQCRKSGRDCVYPAADDKISVSRAEFEELQARCAKLQQRLDEAKPEIHRDGYPDLVSQRTSTVTSEGTTHSEPFSNNQISPNEGRVLHDTDGTPRYLGGSSGAVFLDYLKEFMSTVFPLAFHNSWPGMQNPETAFLASRGRYQTHDSRPLLVSDVDWQWFPSRTEASILVAEFRYLAQDGNGDFPCGGIYYWGDWEKLLQDARPSADIRPPPSFAILNAAFAIASQARKSANPSAESTSYGDPYFARARYLIGNPLDYITIDHAAALGLLAFYLMERNRRDSAYMFVSIAVHIVIMHGYHRASMTDETAKRIFWTIYVLERRLSILMGRPPLISDLAIRTQLPENMDEYPSAVGMIANIELARISTYIVCNVYQIASQTTSDDRSIYVDNALQMLNEWSQGLPSELRPAENGLSNDRACCELHMSYNQLIILTLRPIYFIAVKKAVADRYLNGRSDLQSHPHLQKIMECSAAARRNLNLGRYMSGLGHFPRLLHGGFHNVFNAAVVLQLHQLLYDMQDESDESDISFAIGAFQNEAKNGNIYAEDCTRVLLDLNLLVHKLRGQTLFNSQQLATSPHAASLPNQTSPYSDVYATASDISTPRSFQWRPPTTSQAAALNSTINEQDPAYPELMTWLNGDDLQLYSI